MNVLKTLRTLIEDEGVGEKEGGVEFTEVELDSPTIEDLQQIYAISDIPTLQAFSRQEPQNETRVTRLDELKDEKFLREWLEKEAGRGGMGGAGGSLWKSIFGGST